MGKFVKVAKVSEIPSGHGKIIRTATSEVAIFNSGGAFYAIENRCPFCRRPLLEGTLQCTEVACPWDQSEPTLSKVLLDPAHRLAATKEVRKEITQGGVVWIQESSLPGSYRLS